MDKLEKLITDRRRELDTLEPPESLWGKIERASRKPAGRNWLRIAATVTVVIGISSLLFIAGFKYKSAKMSLSERNPQLIETEIYYKSVINTLMEEAKPVLAENPDLEKELHTDMQQLENICTEIKKDLKDNVSNQEVIEAVIMNYRIRIKILEQMLNELSAGDTIKEKRDGHEI